MKRVLYLFLLVFPVLTADGGSGLYTYRVGQESYVTINGTTNVNTFRCTSEGDVSRGVLMADYKEDSDAVYFTDALLEIPVSSFDCGNRRMNRDFIDALGGNAYPEIEIRLIETYHTESPCGAVKGLMAIVEIMINGITKQTTVPVALSSPGDFRLHILGSKTLKMSDFEIDPPSPALGLIRVRDAMEVEFNLIVEANLLTDM